MFNKFAFLGVAGLALSLSAFAAQKNNADNPDAAGGGGGGKKADPAANDQLSSIREAAEARSAAAADPSANGKKVDKKKDAADKKAAFNDYKLAVQDNKNFIKELFQKAEAAWKAKSYKEAGIYYQAVSQATAPGTEDMVEVATERINVEMENLAKDHIKASDDAGLQRDFMKQIDELSIVTKEFVLTKSKDDAQRRLNSLKSRSEIVAYVDYQHAEQLISEGKFTEGIAALNTILSNPRYENSIPALKAARKIDELNKNEETRAKLKVEFTAKADKEAPNLINAAKNYAANNMPKSAREKLQTILDKYPGTTYADEAKRMLEEVRK